MLADFYIPRLSNDKKIAVQENNLVDQILYRSLVPSKKTASKPHWTDLASIPVSLLGVILFAKPSFIFGGDFAQNGGNFIGICFALGCAITGACADVVIRMMGTDIHYTVSTLYFSMGGLVLSSVYLLSGIEAPCSYHIALLV